MKKVSILAVPIALLVGAGAALAASGTPSVSPVSASFSLSPTHPPKFKSCTGVGGASYLTTSDSWSGAQTDTSSTPGPYSLTGTLTVTAHFTINTSTGAGVGRGTVTLTSGGTTVYSGGFMGALQSTGTGSIVSRGSVNVPFLSPPGSSLVSNSELTVDLTTLHITGSLGGPASIPDLSVEYNNVTC